MKLFNTDENADSLVEISEFKPPRIKETGEEKSYRKVKSTFKQDLTLRDKSFKLDEVVLAQMKVEEEEQRVFDAKVKLEVDAQVAQIKDEAYKEAFDKGMAEGTENGFNEKVNEMDEVLIDFSAIVEDMLKLRENMAKENEKALVRLVYLIAEVILNKEIDKDSQLITDTIKKVIEYSGAEEDIRIKISARDFRAVEEIKKDILDNFGKIKNLNIEPDDGVANGGCIVDTNFGQINADLPIRLAAVAKTIGFAYDVVEEEVSEEKQSEEE